MRNINGLTETPTEDLSYAEKSGRYGATIGVLGRSALVALAVHVHYHGTTERRTNHLLLDGLEEAVQVALDVLPVEDFTRRQMMDLLYHDTL